MREWFEDLSDIMKVFVIGVVLLFAIGGVTLAWISFFGPKFADQQNNQYHHSTTHQEAVVQDFTARCAELATTTDPVARRAIEVVIAQRVGVEDLNRLQMADSVRTCVNNSLNDYLNGGSK